MTQFFYFVSNGLHPEQLRHRGTGNSLWFNNKLNNVTRLICYDLLLSTWLSNPSFACWWLPYPLTHWTNQSGGAKGRLPMKKILWETYLQIELTQKNIYWEVVDMVANITRSAKVVTYSARRYNDISNYSLGWIELRMAVHKSHPKIFPHILSNKVLD